MIKIIKSISIIFVAFFVVVTGTVLLPQIINTSQEYFSILYGLSTIITATFLVIFALSIIINIT